MRESIGLTGQFAAIDEVLSGRENLVLVAHLRHLDSPGSIANDLLQRFILTDAGGRRGGTYSGGMRRRLDIAMSLVGSRRSFSSMSRTLGLDPEVRLELRRAVRELADQGTAVLLTKQSLDEGETFADRIAILHQGEIIANGTLAELKQLLPPARVEYVEKQPSLEEISWRSSAPLQVPASLPTKSPDERAVAIMLLFVVVVFGGAIDTGSLSYVNYLLPGTLLITIASGVAYTAYRLYGVSPIRRIAYSLTCRAESSSASNPCRSPGRVCSERSCPPPSLPISPPR